MENTRFRFFLYGLSFIEGANVMVCELAGAKMLAPYFGTSLYVWAAALAVTLGGLMCGYFLGGIVSSRFKNNLKALFIVVLAAAVGLIIMPISGESAMKLTISLPLKTGSVVALCLFMLPPLFLMGMVSPLIINLLNNEAKLAGNSAGNVYAISTLGGILATLSMGFYFIPEYGLKIPLVNAALVMAVPVILYLIFKGSKSLGLLSSILIIGLSAASLRLYSQYDTNLLYSSEGLLGKLEVRNQYFESLNRKLKIMTVNNTWQTIADPEDDDFDYWPYTRVIPQLIPEKHNKVLILGMGGGTVARHLIREGKSVYGVEIDSRIIEVAKKQFKLPEEVIAICEDARYWIRKADQSFDVILFDVFKGESAPEHLLSSESIMEAKNILNQNGFLLFNLYGYLDGEHGALARALIKTIQYQGLYCELRVTTGSPDERNLLLIATQNQEEIPKTIFYKGQLLAAEAAIPNLDEAIILTDEAPQLHLFAKAAFRWRQLYRNLQQKK